MITDIRTSEVLTVQPQPQKAQIKEENDDSDQTHVQGSQQQQMLINLNNQAQLMALQQEQMIPMQFNQMIYPENMLKNGIQQPQFMPNLNDYNLQYGQLMHNLIANQGINYDGLQSIENQYQQPFQQQQQQLLQYMPAQQQLFQNMYGGLKLENQETGSDLPLLQQQQILDVLQLQNNANISMNFNNNINNIPNVEYQFNNNNSKESEEKFSKKKQKQQKNKSKNAYNDLNIANSKIVDTSIWRKNIKPQTGHIPTNFMNILIPYLLKIWKSKVPCLNGHTEKKENQCECKHCQEFSIIKALKKSRKNVGLNAFKELWENKRIRAVSLEYINRYCLIDILDKSGYRNPYTKISLLLCLKIFHSNVQKPENFYKFLD